MMSIRRFMNTRRIPRSVRRTATARVRREIAADRGPHRVMLDLGRRVGTSTRAWLAYLLVGVALLLLSSRISFPACLIPDGISARDFEESSKGVLLTMWQVQAASIALFVTLFVLLIELTRVRGSLVSVAELFGRSKLATAFQFGLATMLVVAVGRVIAEFEGLTLATVVEFGFLLGSIALLGPSFVFVLQMLDNDAIDERQRILIAELAKESVHEELILNPPFSR